MIKMQYQGANQKPANQRTEKPRTEKPRTTKNSNKIRKQSIQTKYPNKVSKERENMKNDILKKRIIIIAAVCLLILLGVALVMIIISQNTYRLIKADAVEGTVYVERQSKGEEELIEAFEGLQLIPEDRVEVMKDSFLSLLLDEDKHLGAEENTLFLLYADGTKEKGNIRIELIAGKALFEIEHKLNEDSNFEVTTPNATLSVRGTMFSVEYNEEQGYTTIEVMDGTVQVDYESGTTSLGAGESIRIAADGAITQGTLEANAGATLSMENDGVNAETNSAVTTEEQILEISYQYLNPEDPGNSDIQILLNVQTSSYSGTERTGIYVTDPAWTAVEKSLNTEAERLCNDYLLPQKADIDQYFTENAAEALQIMENGGAPAKIEVTEWFPENMTISCDEEEIEYRVTRVTMAVKGNYSPAYNADGEQIPAPPNSYLEGDNYLVIGSVEFCIYGEIQ